MTKIEWSPESVFDLNSIHQYIARDSIYYADQVLDKILESILYAAEFPESSGLVQKNELLNIRERFVFDYRIIYRYLSESNQIRILTIIHGSRRTPKNLSIL